ncbi:MAG: hypothetical protein ACNS60_20295 [Candidatus Cyclobacteriaceae bacterium M2_1C_046]
MCRLISFTLLLVSYTMVNGQNIYQLRAAEFQPRPGGNITTFNAPENLSPVGSNYLNESWMAGVIHPFKGDSINGYLFKFNIAQNLLEIQTKSTVKVIEGVLVEYFTIYDKNSGFERYFINGSLINSNVNKGTGFFEVVESGEELSLLADYEIEVSKANYDPKFDIGDKQDKIIQKRNLNFLKNGELVPVKNKFKKNRDIFNSKVEEIENLIKKENLDYNSEADLIKLVRFYNLTN